MTDVGFVDESDLEEEAGGFPGLYWGIVRDNKDPHRLGRVKAHVAGITKKETTWAYPVGMPGAGFASATGGKGGFFVPRKGAMVLVGFIHGKLAEPFYFTGHFSLAGKGNKAGTPEIVQKQTVDEAPNVRVLAETETFEVYITDTATEQKIVIQTLTGSTMIEMDAKDGSIKLKALKSIIIEAPGVEIDGLVTTIKKRPVSALGLSI